MQEQSPKSGSFLKTNQALLHGIAIMSLASLTVSLFTGCSASYGRKELSADGKITITHFFNQEKGILSPGSPSLPPAKLDVLGKIIDGVHHNSATYVIVGKADGITKFNLLMAGIPERNHFVQFKVTPDRVQRVSGLKWLHGLLGYQSVIEGGVDLTGCDPKWGTLQETPLILRAGKQSSSAMKGFLEVFKCFKEVPKI